MAAALNMQALRVSGPDVLPVFAVNASMPRNFQAAELRHES